MKKGIIINALILTSLIVTSPVYAQSAEVARIQTFIESIINVMSALAGLVATGFFVLGGFQYITSTGNPESLDRSKKTLLYSGVGLAIVIAAFVLSNIVTDLATTAFGK
jgi:hypothetical protein